MQNVLILGPTSGMAKALAYELASKNINLILAGRNIDEIKRIASDMMIRHNVSVSVKNFDALQHIQHEDFFQECVKEYGTLDGLFLAYGYMADQKVAESDFETAKRMIETNYTSVVSILSIAANYFEKHGKGFICAISSVAGDRGRQSNYIYGSTKGALSVYLQGLRNRLSKSNVAVITIKPGFVDTKMTYGMLKNSPLVAQPEQVAKAIYRAVIKKKDVVYTLWFWKYIMLIIKSIPERVFKRLSL